MSKCDGMVCLKFCRKASMELVEDDIIHYSSTDGRVLMLGFCVIKRTDPGLSLSAGHNAQSGSCWDRSQRQGKPRQWLWERDAQVMKNSVLPKSQNNQNAAKLRSEWLSSALRALPGHGEAWSYRCTSLSFYYPSPFTLAQLYSASGGGQERLPKSTLYYVI